MAYNSSCVLPPCPQYHHTGWRCAACQNPPMAWTLHPAQSAEAASRALEPSHHTQTGVDLFGQQALYQPRRHLLAMESRFLVYQCSSFAIRQTHSRARSRRQTFKQLPGVDLFLLLRFILQQLNDLRAALTPLGSHSADSRWGHARPSGVPAARCCTIQIRLAARVPGDHGLQQL